MSLEHMIFLLMSLNYDMLLPYAQLTNNLFGLTFRCNRSDLYMQLFLLKIANWRTVYLYFITCSLNKMSLKKSFTCLQLICLNINLINQFTVTSSFITYILFNRIFLIFLFQFLSVVYSAQWIIGINSYSSQNFTAIS